MYLLLPGDVFLLLVFGGGVVLFPTFLALLSICSALLFGLLMSTTAQSALDARGSIPWFRVSLRFSSSLQRVDCFFTTRGFHLY